MARDDFRIRQALATARLTRSSSQYIEQCLHLDGIYSMLPASGSWAYDSGESLLNKLEDGASPLLLWPAILEDYRALALTLAWKSREATLFSVAALNKNAISASAMLARGALEAATAGIDHLVKVTETLNKLGQGNLTEKDFAETIERLERGSIRGLWGRKGGAFQAHVNANHFFDHQRSVLKYAAQSASGTEIVEHHKLVYDTLCSMAHPSADGHQPYMALPEVREAPQTTVQVELRRTPQLAGLQSAVLIDAILWALGWSAAHSVRAWSQLEERHLHAMEGIDGPAASD